MRRGIAQAARRLRPFAPALCLSLTACNLLVHVPVDHEPATLPGAPTPLGSGELLRFTLDNLGEVSPGLLYRSRRPGRSLLEFLTREKNLRFVINLTGNVHEAEQEILGAVGGEIVQLRMSTRTPPRVDQILELIRVTHEARERGQTILIHCHAGADRTGVMVGIWRMLFQGVRDIDALKSASLLHRHFPPAVPMTFETLERFRPELFQPLVDEPALLKDRELRKDLEERYFKSQPLLSGSRRLAKGPLRAGVARVSLESGLEWPIQMATYGPYPGGAKGVREPGFARALVLDNGAVRLGIVSCDLMIFDERLRAAVIERVRDAGLKLDDVLIAATHTHTGIGGYVDHWLAEFYIIGTYDPAIAEHLVDRIASSLLAANEDLRAARLGAGRTFVRGLSFNRRLGDTVDEEVGILRIVGENDEPLAAVVNYAAHPILEPNDGLLSSDYPGYLTRKLDESHGFGIFLNGALGDVNAQPRERAGAWREEGLAESVARTLFEAVDAEIGRIAVSSEISLGAMTASMKLPAVNPNIIPDFLFPLDWLLGWAVNWPAYAPLEGLRLGDTAIVACATELGVRLGLQIKRRSPAPFTFVVSHSNSYAGYAVTGFAHGKGKLDPTSAMCMNGSTYGPRLVEEACDVLEAQWGVRLDPHDQLLSRAAEARLSRPDSETERAEAVRLEEEASMARADSTIPQSRRLSFTGRDAVPDRLRLEVSQLYLEDRRTGQRVDGTYRETRLALHLRGPWDLELGLQGGYFRSDWREPGGQRGGDDGASDLALDLRRAFTLYSSPIDGSAVRLIPAAGVVAPTGKTDASAPIDLSPATGVWRPRASLALDFTWETYRSLVFDTGILTAIDRHDGRRPGELWESAFRYSERHGLASFHLDLVSQVRYSDRRRGGRQTVDVDGTSFSLGFRPGISIHLGDAVELTGQWRIPVASSGEGISEGQGGAVGILVGF